MFFQASKKVSFASSAPEPLDESPEIKQENNEKYSRLDQYERDPNVSVFNYSFSEINQEPWKIKICFWYWSWTSLWRNGIQIDTWYSFGKWILHP